MDHGPTSAAAASPLPCCGRARPSYRLLHIWLAELISGTVSVWIFAVCWVVWWTCQYDGQAHQLSFKVVLPKYVFYLKWGCFQTPFHSSMMSHGLLKLISGRALQLTLCSCWAARGTLIMLQHRQGAWPLLLLLACMKTHWHHLCLAVVRHNWV